MNEQNDNVEQLQQSEDALSSATGLASGVASGAITGLSGAAGLMSKNKNKESQEETKEEKNEDKDNKKDDGKSTQSLQKKDSNEKKPNKDDDSLKKEAKPSGNPISNGLKKGAGNIGKASSGAIGSVGNAAKNGANQYQQNNNRINQAGREENDEKSESEKDSEATENAARGLKNLAVKVGVAVLHILLNPITLIPIIVVIIVALIVSTVASIMPNLEKTHYGTPGVHYLAGDEEAVVDPDQRAFYDEIKKIKDSYQSNYAVTINSHLLIATSIYATNTDEDVGDNEMPDRTWQQLKNELNALAQNLIKVNSADNQRQTCVRTCQNDECRNACNSTQFSDIYTLDEEQYYNYLKTVYLPKKFEVYLATMDNPEAKVDEMIERIKDITQYYDDLLRSGGFGSFGMLCSEIEVEGIGMIPFEDYVAGVINSETSPGVITSAEARRAVAIAARTYALVITNNCTTPIKNSQAHQVFDNGVPMSPLVEADIEATKGLVITYDGELFLSEYDAFGGSCSGGTCTASYLKLPNKDNANVRHSITVEKKYIGWAAGHGRGISQYYANYLGNVAKYGYEEILKFFYRDGVEIMEMSQMFYNTGFIGTEGIESELLFPVAATPDRAECVSAREYYSGGKYHGSTDIFDAFEGKFDELPIISSTNGRIIGFINDQYCANPENTNSQVPPLQYRSGCAGNGIRIMIDDPESNYNGAVIAYWHFDKVNPELKNGDTVSRGQLLGFMGSTGNSTGPHLHYNVKYQGRDVLVDRAMSNYCKYAFENR